MNKLIKKNLVLKTIVLLLLACKNEVNMIKCKGLEGESEFLYFKSETEGYSFNNKIITKWENLTNEQINDSEFYPTSLCESSIYRTIDGGENWVKINSSLNFSYFNIATKLNDDIYILQNNERDDYNFNITIFSLKDQCIKKNINTEPISAIWSNDNKVFYTNNRESIKLYSLDTNQNLDSIRIENYVLQGLVKYNKLFAIFSKLETSYFGSLDKEIKLNIIPKSIIKKDQNSIIIAGNSLTNENEISLISYDTNTNHSRVIKKIKNYSIIRNLQSNEKAIIGFIGNIKGFFTKYDLLYSLDKGKSWQIKKLIEKNYVGPSCLIDNIVYIYSGSMIQKIILK